jgi:UDP-N-acetylglucosamine 2-epimerase (non-hydrolysing)
VKVLFICGTRPEAIKLAPVIKALDQVLDLFAITPDYDLDLMQPDQSLFSLTSRALMKLQGVLEQECPDLVMVQGDTTTTFVGALAASYCQIPVGHVEAGLRTADKYRPFPEEINRRLTTHIADLHFAPTESARQNLLLRRGLRQMPSGSRVIPVLML